MGTVTTGPCVSVADLTAADNMFQITPSASSTDVIKNDNVFQVCFTDPAQGTKSAQYIGENNLAKKVAIIYNSSDIYSSGIEAKFVEEAKKAGFENLKGHRSVGGMRASIYNAMPKEGVEKLVAFMKKFEEENA